MPQSRSRLDVCTIVRVTGDILQLASLVFRPRAQLAAENLFLRKQLALYFERQVKPRRADDATRLTLVALSRLIDWRQLLMCLLKTSAPILATTEQVVGHRLGRRRTKSKLN
jgi:hypothetical protein